MIKVRKELSIFDILSVLLTVFVFTYTVFQDNKIKNINYQENSVASKPILELVGKPRIFIEKIYFTDKDYVDYPLIDTFVIGIDIEIRQVMKFKNIGNDKADIMLWYWSDTITGEDYIRNLLFNKKELFKKTLDTPIKDFFRGKELLPNDTIIIDEKRKIGMDLITHDFVSHFLIMYENNFGNRYDTYIKSKFKLNQPLFEPMITKTGQFAAHYYKKTSTDFFELEVIPSRTTKVYSRKEKRKLNRIEKSFENN